LDYENKIEENRDSCTPKYKRNMLKGTSIAEGVAVTVCFVTFFLTFKIQMIEDSIAVKKMIFYWVW